jgi:hypothetical protein
LSDDGGFLAKPELEIFADDVQCGHGATVIEIDHNQLFYLMARGIPENKARAMLVNAFVAEIVEELEDEPLVEALEERHRRLARDACAGLDPGVARKGRAVRALQGLPRQGNRDGTRPRTGL